MTPIYSHDYIQSYEAGIQALKTRPLDRDLQHRVVLALARAGALDFALSEYDRYGLAAVRDNEDVMALNGRLSKDLYLRSSGAKAREYACDAARKYEIAFQNTLGYYSGVNSATMALMADLPAERVAARIEAIEALLPAAPEVTATDHYFIEATRAECFLLKGDVASAAAALHGAIDFDPLNYAAHASTLKQFMMICIKQGVRLDWLSDFKPPRALHYAGHIRLDYDAAEQDALEASILDALQQQDVGFGFGALAAGGDILFAENLLEQGADLHVVLPCDKDVFLRESVTPFGQDWEARFESCLARASSLRILTRQTSPNWPDKYLNRLGGLSAMGHVILQAQSLSVAPLQILILKDMEAPSYTAVHARDWSDTGHAQFRLSGGTHRPLALLRSAKDLKLPCVMKHSGALGSEYFEDMASAVTAALQQYTRQDGSQIALHMQIDGEDSEAVVDKILAGGSPQSLLASEAFASVLAAVSGHKFEITYAGQVAVDQVDSVRCYTVQTAPSLAYTVP